MENEIFTVSSLNNAIKKQLESRFTTVKVRGEISNFKEQASGHLYFTLKDAEAQISAVLFRGNAQHLTRIPKAGDQVVAIGEISVYTPRGNYQIIVRQLEYAGTGELLLKLHELKTKLNNLGWFDAQHKKSLPKIPKTIGVVTSPTGSVIQDILNILKRRFSGFHLILNPVKVQGEGAAAEIAQAIEQFNRYGLADVLIVGRGGGSLEDLWAFNEEIVAQAIFASKIPIISAVGHETDYCIADFVADVRAPTPSAAAEIVMAEKNKELQHLTQMRTRLTQTVQGKTREYRHQLKGMIKQPCFSLPYALLGKFAQLLDDAKEDLFMSFQKQISYRQMRLLALQKQAMALKPSTQYANMRQKLKMIEKAIALRMQQKLEERKKSFKQLISHMQSINPKNLLAKGYCILFQEKINSVILSAKDLSLDQHFRVKMQDGEILANVNKVNNE